MESVGDDGPGGSLSEPVGRGIILRWALDLVLDEIDNEAEVLIHSKESPFHCPEKWTWDSLLQFSLDSQQTFAVKKAPVLWSVLATVATSRQRKSSMEIEEESRDPWQVRTQLGSCPVHAEIMINRELLLFSQSCSIYETSLLPSSPESLALSSSHATPTALSTDFSLGLE